MIGGDFLQLTPGRGPSSVPVLGPWHELLAWCLLVKAGESAVSECHMIYPLNHPEKQPVSKRSPGVYWQVRLPDLWSDPGLPVDFSSSFSTHANNSLVRTMIYPCFPTNRPQPIFPHKNPTSMSSSIFFAKTSKMQEPQIHPQHPQTISGLHPKADPKYPPNNLRTS
jgi:hypothetical protein